MKRLFRTYALFAALLLGAALTSCSEEWTHHPMPDFEKPDPKPTPEPEPADEKPVVLWIDAEANFARLRTKEQITATLEKARSAGFNAFVVDVKPVQGDVLYASDFLPACTRLNGTSIPDRGFDYLQYFIDEAHRLDMRVTVSTTIMTMGLPASQTGPVYTDPAWADKCCVEYLPTGLHDIRESTEWGVFAFLNPVLPEVRDYVMRMVEEIVTKYAFDGYALDYCRYCNIHSDFSQASREAFEAYANLTVERFPEDIYTYNGSDPDDYTPGKHYNRWVEWRATVIQGYVKEIRRRIKAIRPEVDLEYWAASWWPLPHTGQNWASPNIREASANYWWATQEYDRTGFADRLDIFQLGSYLSRVFGPDDNESVEYAIARAKRLLDGACTLYGTISCDQPTFDLESAVYLCLRETAGVMVFELSHIINNDKWDAVQAGIDRYRAELAAASAAQTTEKQPR